MTYYKLVNKKPVKCDINDITLDDNSITKSKFSDVEVSTVFLMIDHSFSQGGPPILFETMIFGGEYDGYQERYSTYDDALLGHEKACNLANKLSIDRENKLKQLGLK